MDYLFEDPYNQDTPPHSPVGDAIEDLLEDIAWNLHPRGYVHPITLQEEINLTHAIINSQNCILNKATEEIATQVNDLKNCMRKKLKKKVTRSNRNHESKSIDNNHDAKLCQRNQIYCKPLLAESRRGILAQAH